MLVSRHIVTFLLLAVLVPGPSRAQHSQSYDDFDSLGLDPVLLHKSGYFTNTQDGYSVVQGRDRRWYYAKLNGFGNVVPPDVPVGALGKRSSTEREFLAGATRHLESEPALRPPGSHGRS